MRNKRPEIFFLVKVEETEQVEMYGAQGFTPEVGKKLTKKQLMDISYGGLDNLVVRHVFDEKTSAVIGALDTLGLWGDMADIILEVNRISLHDKAVS